MAAGRVRGRALPPLRVDAGEDAERLPSPAGEEGWGTGWGRKSHTQVVSSLKRKMGGATEIRICTRAICSPNCRKRAAESGAQPGGGNVPTVTSLIPWGLPGRWFPCTILLAPTLSQPLECTSCRFPVGPICWPHLSWQPVPRVPLPISRNLALQSQAVSSSLSLFSLHSKAI